MALFPGNPTARLGILATVLMVLGAAGAHAADLNGHLSSKAQSLYCEKTYGKLYPPPSKSDNRYVLLLMFDASAKGAVDAFFHTAPTDAAAGAANVQGCTSDPEAAKPTRKDRKGGGIGVDGSCPTDCVPPHLHTPKQGEKKRTARKSGDPLGDDGWGIFSADDGSDNQVLVWQIFVKDAKHAGLILESLKKDSKFPSKDYRGNLVIGYFDPSSAQGAPNSGSTDLRP